MRILFLGNNWVGWQVLRWLKERDEEIVGLVLHPPQKRKYGDEILRTGRLDPARIFDGSQLHKVEIKQAIRTLQPDLGVSALFGYVLRREIIDLLPAGCINLHPALLPYNRGTYPNVWSIVEGTPAGATLHYVDAGVDTGDIIAQKQVPVDPVDTGETLYRKLERACVEIFEEAWPYIRNGQAPRIPQIAEMGTFHRTSDVDRLDEVDLDRTYTARELIDILRARTFPPHAGAYFRSGNRKVYLRLQLFHEDDLPEDCSGSHD